MEVDKKRMGIKMKKIILGLLFMALLSLVLPGCSLADKNTFNPDKEIIVVSREDGSGTRGAFVELFAILIKGDGIRKDLTTKEAIISKQTDVMMQNISGSKYALGYISLGSLNEGVKALKIAGIEARAENIKNGSYPISRPFIIATKSDISSLSRDFINFIMSAQGQEVIARNYIAISDDLAPYKGIKASGKIVVAGSTSVSPVMEKLKEAYLLINPKVVIEIQQSDSSSGMLGVIDGNSDIAMISRDLTKNELEELQPIKIALDGIVLIVNKGNPISDLTKEQVRSIYTGEIVKWSEIHE